MAGGFLCVPLWVVRSGLPAWLNEKTKSPHAWPVVAAVMALDAEANPTGPGTVEIPVSALAAVVGLDAAKTEAALKKARSAGVLRCFLPDHPDEPALLAVMTPLPAPTPWETVRSSDPDLFAAPVEAFRYAEATPASGEVTAGESAPAEAKLKATVDLYLSTVSQRMNTFVLDELRLIAGRFDLDLTRRVFARARAKEIQNLGWILKEIRRESDIAARAAETRRAQEAEDAEREQRAREGR